MGWILDYRCNLGLAGVHQLKYLQNQPQPIALAFSSNPNQFAVPLHLALLTIGFASC